MDSGSLRLSQVLSGFKIGNDHTSLTENLRVFDSHKNKLHTVQATFNLFPYQLPSKLPEDDDSVFHLLLLVWLLPLLPLL